MLFRPLFLVEHLGSTLNPLISSIWSAVRDVEELEKLPPPIMLLCLVRFFTTDLFVLSSRLGSTFAVSLVSRPYSEFVTFLSSLPKSLDFVDSFDFSRCSVAP